ncbi:MAG: hypothetical protein Ct9H300mP11_33260 [Chloroflexota bacterium]|nr:MAG: hypothetical protein Ct9H300mP11_33260 [Chloroflexota bacterium]
MYQPGGGPRQPELDFEKIIGNISPESVVLPND